MASLIDCVTEIVRGHSHKRSRWADAVASHEEQKTYRQRRKRLGEFVIGLMKAVYEDYGGKAYNLCVLLAGK